MNYGVFLILYFIDLGARFSILVFDAIELVFYKVNRFELIMILSLSFRL